MTDSTKASERLNPKRFSNESDVAFVTMLRAAANNLCDEQLWKDLCNEAADRLEQESKPCTCKERINSFCDACIEHIMKEDSARTTPQTQGVEEWCIRNPHLGIAALPNDVLIDWDDYKKLRDAALTKNTPPKIALTAEELAATGAELFKMPAPMSEDKAVGIMCDAAFCGRTLDNMAACRDAYRALAKNTPPLGEQFVEQQSGVTGTCANAQLTNGDVQIVPAPSPTVKAVAKDALEKVAEAVQDSMTITKIVKGFGPTEFFRPPLSDCMHIAQAAIAAYQSTLPYSDAQVRALVEATYNVVNGIGYDVDTEDALGAALAPFKGAV